MSLSKLNLRDGQTFLHWVKSDVQDMDYPYAKFNYKPPPIQYSDEDYNKHLQSPTWTKSETDHLLHICHRYDLRWPVIVDRYSPLPPRTTDDLQARYYEVIGKLRESKTILTESMKRVESHSVFDPEYEHSRRMQQELIFRK